MRRARRLFAILFLVGLLLGPNQAQAQVALPQNKPVPKNRDFPPPKNVGNPDLFGTRIPRTMHLLASSNMDREYAVRILFYGQSITEQDWAKQVEDFLRAKYPFSHLIIQNRAIGGFSSQLLVKTAETDLYSFYPDLLIFHVYGSHIEYENIIRRVRERTTAEILLQTDHVTKDEALTEITDPAQLTPKQWDAWMNNLFLPEIAQKYQAELVDQHTLWKQYLRDYSLPAKALLKDAVHLNDHGCFLMAELVKPHFVHRPELFNETWNGQVQTFNSTNLQRTPAGWELAFEGNRVDLIIGPAADKQPAQILVDGKKPSSFPELYGRTRTTYFPDTKWPCLLLVNHEAPLLLEEWTLKIKEPSEDFKKFKFEVTGSVTGPDGEGNSEERFVSKSKRVIIDPADWNFEYAIKVFKRKPPENFQIQWRILPFHLDEVTCPPARIVGKEIVRTVAQGLNPGKHRLNIIAGPKFPLEAVRIYRPPLHNQAKK